MTQCLFEKRSLNNLLTPIAGLRAGFRCFDVSENFFGLGSSSGDVFIFSRICQRLLRRVPAASAKIDRVAFNPANDNVFCAASNRGELVIIEHNTLLVHPQPSKELYRSEAHANSTVSQLLWTRSGSCFIGGDHRGVVSVTDLYALNDMVLFDISPTNILTLDSRIIQIDTFRDRLVISTLTASYLCDLDGKRFTKIGKKSRNGVFGACFSEALPEDDDYPTVYCVRPGGRLWQANNFGEVDCTLSFRHEGSTNIDHVPIPLHGTTMKRKLFDRKVQFGVLFSIDEQLMTFTDEALYILQVQDCDFPCVVWQTTSFRNRKVIESKVESSSIFFMHQDGALTEWGFTMSILQNVFYILPRSEQRLTAILQNINWDQVSKYLNIIRREQFRGRELMVRRSDLSLVQVKTDFRNIQILSIQTLIDIFHYLEGIFYSLDKRWYGTVALLVLPWHEYFFDNLRAVPLPSNKFTKETPLLPTRSSDRQNSYSDVPKSITLPKQESAIRHAHRKLLDRISHRLQKEIADSLLVEISGLLWATPHILQGQRFIDHPIADWGIRIDMSNDCDICGERLVLHDIEEDVVIHFCGHLFHATCSISDSLCCVCMQNSDDYTINRILE
ncbi:Hermansky-Pudlak syndrome 5 protein homolog [Varroa jacobsoni]|uniref:HPS5-like beta-propeller domain-containing protein n=1 Tax=Varroa destructor TaxID=109461 RepID=A0A7M7JBN8_VARDE|nr:Hermansky-Pudlak syndrome 5 protein homolog [Varroa destructor]XP_022710679.1 Hermansky-Pudlak syndrome 5 protein homolog [Varroa jacobsoni]